MTCADAWSPVAKWMRAPVHLRKARKPGPSKHLGRLSSPVDLGSTVHSRAVPRCSVLETHGPMPRWFVFTMGIGLLPFSVSVLLQLLRGVPSKEWQNPPELLFFSVMVCASRLDGIFASLSTSHGIGRGEAGLRVNLYHEAVFLAAKLAMAGLTLTTCWGLGVVLHARYVKGDVDAFKPERRIGPADRRASLYGH